MNSIRTLSEFDQAITAGLIKLLVPVPAAAIAEFRASLQFGSRRLAHTNYGMLLTYVDSTRTPDLFAYFGITKDRFEAINHKYCGSGTGECFDSPNSICDAEECEENGPR